MAYFNQIADIVNSVNSQMFGNTAVTVTDTGGLVSFGTRVRSSSENIDAFYKTLVDRIARTIVVNRPYEAKRRVLRLNVEEWGLIMQKIRMKAGEAVANNCFYNTETERQKNPFDIEGTITVSQKLFEKRGVFEHDEVYPTKTQLDTAFTSMGAFGAFYAGLETSVANRIAKEVEGLDNLAVASLIANTYANGKAIQKRNVIAEYNATHADSVTVANFMESTSFGVWFAKQLEMTRSFMADLCTIYNAEDAENHTPSEFLVVDMLEDISAMLKYDVRSEVFNESFITMPNYNEIPYWQGRGTGASAETFAERSKIAIENEEISENPVTVNNVICCMRDIEACGVMFDHLEKESIYNPASRVNNVFWHAEKGYFADGAENCVIFYAEDTEANPSTNTTGNRTTTSKKS